MAHFLDQLDKKPDKTMVPAERIDELTTAIGAKLDALEVSHPYIPRESSLIDGQFVSLNDPRDEQGENSVWIKANVRMSKLEYRTAFVYLYERTAVGETFRLGTYLEHDREKIVDINHEESTFRPEMQEPEVEHFLMLANSALAACM